MASNTHSDRIEQAQLLIDAALALLEKHTQIDVAANTLVEAADILAGNHHVLRSRLGAATDMANRLLGLTVLLNDWCATKYYSQDDSGLWSLAGVLHDETDRLIDLMTDPRLIVGPGRGEAVQEGRHD